MDPNQNQQFKPQYQPYEMENLSEVSEEYNIYGNDQTEDDYHPFEYQGTKLSERTRMPFIRKVKLKYKISRSTLSSPSNSLQPPYSSYIL